MSQASSSGASSARLDAIPTRFVRVAQARREHGDRVDRLAPFLMRADPLADAVVASFEHMAPGEGFRLFARAAAEGIAKVSGAPDAMHAFFESVEAVPQWVDFPTCDRGGELFLRAGALSGLVLGARSIVLGYASPGGNKPLVMTGRLVEQAPRRLQETSRFVQLVAQPGAMRPGGLGYQVTLKVRVMHAKVRRMLLASPAWRSDSWGLPINQHDMAGTTLLFSLALVDGLRTLGVDVDHEEGASYMHLWRWAGRLSGVDDELLPTGEQDAARLALLIAATQGDPDDDARALTAAFFRAPLTAARTDRERRAAHVQRVVAQVAARALLGDVTADKLAVAKLPHSLAMKALRSVVRLREAATHRSSVGRARAVAEGQAYWRTVVAQGEGAERFAFAPPSALGRQRP